MVETKSIKRRVRVTAAAIAVVGLTIGAPVAATAQVSSISGPTVTVPDTVLDTTLEQTTTTAAPAPAVKDQVLAETVSNNGLAVTGADIAGMALVGTFAIGIGAGLLVSRRRRTVNS